MEIKEDAANDWRDSSANKNLNNWSVAQAPQVSI